MQALATVDTRTELQLSDDDKFRIGIAWDALSSNSRRAYQLAWRQLGEFLSAKGEVLDNLTDTQLAAYLSILDTKGIAPATLAVCLAAVKWYFSNVKGCDVQFPISQKRLKTIRRDAKGRGQVDALVWADVERVCAFAEADKSVGRASRYCYDTADVRLPVTRFGSGRCQLRTLQTKHADCPTVKDRSARYRCRVVCHK